MSDYNNKTFTKKCILSCLFVISLLMTCFTVKVYAKENVKLNHKKLTMQDGKTKTLKLSGMSKKVTWTSSNKAVVKVVSKGSNKAALTAKAAGTATVTAKVDKKKYKCKVTVKYKKYKDVYVTVRKKQYTLTLYDNASAKQLYQQLPMTITMDEMNGNEKYYYMDTKFKTKARIPYKIQTGDLMLYGNDCLVFFYKNFKTEYSYTPLGRLKNTSGFAKAVGKDSVEITISRKKSVGMSSTTDTENPQDDLDSSSKHTESGDTESGNTELELGFIEDAADLREAVGMGDVSLTFSLEN